MTFPAPGNPIRLKPYRMTGDRVADRDGSRYALVTEEFSAAGRPLGSSALEAATLAYTPAMYAKLLGQTGEAYATSDDLIISQPRPWIAAGRPCNAPPRAALIMGYPPPRDDGTDYGGSWADTAAHLVSVVRTAVGAQLSAMNVWSAFLLGEGNLPSGPGLGLLPADSFLEADQNVSVTLTRTDVDIDGTGAVVTHTYVEPVAYTAPADVPVVDPAQWLGREVLVIWLCWRKGLQYDFIEIPWTDSVNYVDYDTDLLAHRPHPRPPVVTSFDYSVVDLVAKRQQAAANLAAVFGGEMFSRAEVQLLSYRYPDYPNSNFGGLFTDHPVGVEITTYEAWDAACLASLNTMAGEAGQTVTNLGSAGVTAVAAAVVAKIREFFSIP